MSGVGPSRKSWVSGSRRWTLVLLALGNASCVPATFSGPAAVTLIQLPAAPAASVSIPLPAPYVPALATAPVATGGLATIFAGRTALDRLRSLDCLSQAIYYEAASESEDGQRAVAQVVLNRVRHPAWPNSVCGVVYQGPMRAGGGCQFTFTCDGSLMRRPGGEAWARARRLAAEALAGYRFEPVGTSTHYHTHYVSPAWAPRLRTTTVIGAHIFYSLPGRFGEAPAFRAAYTGSEPLPRPTMTLLRRASAPAGPGLAALVMPQSIPVDTARAPAPIANTAPDPRLAAANLPESTVREEYRHSGQWRADAPAAITGR